MNQVALSVIISALVISLTFSMFTVIDLQNRYQILIDWVYDDDNWIELPEEGVGLV